MLFATHSSKIIQRKGPVTCVRRCHAISASIRTSQVTRHQMRRTSCALHDSSFRRYKIPSIVLHCRHQFFLPDIGIPTATSVHPTPAAPDLVIPAFARCRSPLCEGALHIGLSARSTEDSPVQFVGVALALVNKNWTEQVPKPRIKRSAITLQTPSLTEP